MNGLPHIPAKYEKTTIGNCWFYFSPQERESHKTLVQEASLEALQATREILDFDPQRRVHVCCYASSEDAQRGLNRNVSHTMAMAPFSSSDCGLVVIHSPNLDPMNADELRLRRILAHEFVHLLVAEQARSTKRLGDDNANMRVSAWLNEGLAEVVSYQSVAAGDRLGKITQAFLGATTFHRFGTLSRWLDDLDDDSRSVAFAHVTGAVNCLCRTHSVRAVFHHIQRIEAFFDPLDCCSPARLAELVLVQD